jgi:hypothetical protein
LAGHAAGARAGELRGNEQVASVIEQFITSGHANLSSQVDNERLFQIFTFYHDRDFKPIWTRDSGPKTKARCCSRRSRRRATMASTRPNTPSRPRDAHRFDQPGGTGRVRPADDRRVRRLRPRPVAGPGDPVGLDDTHIQPHGPGPLT